MKNVRTIEKLKELGEPGERLCPFGPQFCNDIESRARRMSGLMLRLILHHSELQNVDEEDVDEMLKFVKAERLKIWEKIRGKSVSFFLSIKDIKENLPGKLASVFTIFPLSEASGVEFSQDLTDGAHEYNETTRKILVPYDPKRPVEEQRFDFAQILYFFPIVEHLALSLTFIRLRELEADLKARQIAAQNVKFLEIRNFFNN